MISQAKTVKEYIASLDDERRPIIKKIDAIITKNLKGTYSRNMQYGMISYTIPHSVYPGGYHCKPSDELPFISLASQKGHISIYHMGLYMNSALLQFLTDEYAKNDLKLDVGKSCWRFKKIDQIPFDIIEKLMKKSSIKEYIRHYKTIDPRNH